MSHVHLSNLGVFFWVIELVMEFHGYLLLHFRWSHDGQILFDSLFPGAIITVFVFKDWLPIYKSSMVIWFVICDLFISRSLVTKNLWYMFSLIPKRPRNKLTGTLSCLKVHSFLFFRNLSKGSIEMSFQLDMSKSLSPDSQCMVYTCSYISLQNWAVSVRKRKVNRYTHAPLSVWCDSYCKIL